MCVLFFLCFYLLNLWCLRCIPGQFNVMQCFDLPLGLKAIDLFISVSSRSRFQLGLCQSRWNCRQAELDFFNLSWWWKLPNERPMCRMLEARRKIICRLTIKAVNILYCILASQGNGGWLIKWWIAIIQTCDSYSTWSLTCLWCLIAAWIVDYILQMKPNIWIQLKLYCQAYM